MENEGSKSLTDVEWEQRTLCIDESCIGVIGPDGRCKECGLSYERGKKQEISEERAVADSEKEVAEDDEYEKDEEDDEEDAVTDIEWEQRTLCRDESCIGVIGPGGRCKECDLPYEDG